MVNGWPDVFQVGSKHEMFEVPLVRDGERSREVGICVKGGDVH